MRRTLPTSPSERDGSDGVSPADEGPLDLREAGLDDDRSLSLAVPVSEIVLRLGGQEYRVDGATTATLDASRSIAGLRVRLRVTGDLVGPCWRCLEPAAVPIVIDAHEFVGVDRDPEAGFDEDLDSTYVDEERVDVALWVRDAFAEAVPAMILCRADCAGLCETCGAELNVGECGCSRETRDPRWDALRDVADRMGIDDSG